MTSAPLLLALALVAQDPAVPGPLDVTVIRPPAGPEVVAHGWAGPLVGVRLSAPVDTAYPEGVVELLQELARPTAREMAERFGARLTFRHEEGHALITLTGPATAFDALVGVLRSATREPVLTTSALQRARSRADGRVLSRLEQPGPRVQRLLWHELFGGPFPTGSAASLLSPEAIRQAGQRLYDPERIRVVVVGDVPEPVVRAAFTRWPRAPGTDAGALVVDSVEAARPQAHREWAGIGYAVDAEPAVVALATELVGRRLLRSPLRHGAARAWRGPGGWAVVVTGATEPGDSVVRATAGVGHLRVSGTGPAESATGVGVALRRMVAEAMALLGPASLEEARTALRHRLLLEARTVSGRAEVIGRLTDALGPVEAARFLEALDAVELDAVRAVLGALLDAPATYVEAR